MIGSLASLTHRHRPFHRPREQRDTLFLLGVIGWTLLPHLAHRPAWCAVMALAILAARGWLAVKERPLPGRWVLWGTLALAGGLTWWSHRTWLGKEAGVTLLVVLLCLKTLELRSRRDAFVVFFLGFFLVLTQLLFSQSIGTAASALLAIWGLLTALVLAQLPPDDTLAAPAALRTAGQQAGMALLLGAPLMVVLFLFFPRVSPLWGLPADGLGRTGLSDSMRLGAVGELAQDDRIAFRVRFEGQPPKPSQLYWRGPVLSAFDGTAWTAGESSFPRALRPRAEPRVRGEPLRYAMTLEPGGPAVLPLLELSEPVLGDNPTLQALGPALADDLRWGLKRAPVQRLQIEARAWPDFEHGPRNPLVGLQDALELPPAHNPRTLAWAAELRRDPRFAEADARTLTSAVLAHIRNQPFRYTLMPGLAEDDPRQLVDHFWFEGRAGFCEHYASAFVVVMRALDVPARVVTGFQGADPELQDGYLVVRNSHAHAWAEVWQAGAGWLRVDPTAAVAPERVERSQRLAPPPGLIAQAFGGQMPAWASAWAGSWMELKRWNERLQNRWNQAVLGYTRDNQLGLLRGLGWAQPTEQDLMRVLAGLLAAGALVGSLVLMWQRRRQDPWQLTLVEVRSALQARGIASAPHDPPLRLAQALRHGPASIDVDGWGAVAAHLEALDAWRYAGAADSGTGGSPASPSANGRGVTHLRGWRREFKRRLRRAAPVRSQNPPLTAAPHS